MKDKRIGLLLALLVLLGCSDFTNKAEYSVLQVAEFEGRSEAITGAVYRTIDGLPIMGVPAEGTNGNVWILLNPKAAPFYKQVPQRQFTISAAVLEEVKARHVATETVIAVLETHMRQ